MDIKKGKEKRRQKGRKEKKRVHSFRIACDMCVVSLLESREQRYIKKKKRSIMIITHTHTHTLARTHAYTHTNNRVRLLVREKNSELCFF